MKNVTDEEIRAIKERVGSCGHAMISPYRMVINNVAAKIRSFTDLQKEAAGRKDGEIPFTAFTASRVLGAAFCKAPVEVVADIIAACPQGLEAASIGGDPSEGS